MNIAVDVIKIEAERVMRAKRGRSKPKMEELEQVKDTIRGLVEENIAIKQIAAVLASGNLIVSEPTLSEFVYREIDLPRLQRQRAQILEMAQQDAKSAQIKSIVFKDKVALSSVRKFIETRA